MTDLEKLKRTFNEVGIPYSELDGDGVVDSYPELGDTILLYVGGKPNDTKVDSGYGFACLHVFRKDGAFQKVVIDYDYTGQ